MKFSTVFILPLAAVASAQVSPCSLSYSPSIPYTHTHNEPLANNIPPNSHRALHQNKVRDHQTALRQHPRQREQGVPRPSRRAGCSQARGRARAQARGHRVCQAKGGPAGRGEREERERRVVALARRAVSPRARAVGRFRVGVTVASTGARRRRRVAQRRRAAVAAAAARRRAVASGPRGLGRPLVGRAACRRRLRLPRWWCLMPGPVRGPAPGLLAVAGWCLSLALGLRLCCLCEGHATVSGTVVTLESWE